ncbi:hypothetical protein ACFL4C_02810, partial [Candidatus Omnitrophota bacterium]
LPGRQELTKLRDSRNDVGRNLTGGELKRNGCGDIFFANIQRVKESIRVLEEFYKLIDTSCAIKLKKARFQVYEIEKAVTLKFPDLSPTRQAILQRRRCR